MTQKDLVKNMAAATNYTQKDINAVLDAFYEAVAGAVSAGESVCLTGFGKFVPVDKNARMCTNPRTGEKFETPAHRAIKFKPSTAVKEAVM